MNGKKRVFLITGMLLILLLTLVSAKIGVEYYCDVTTNDCKTLEGYMNTLGNVYDLDVEVFFYQFPEEEYDSMTTALALECAEAQGMFDEYKDALIEENSYSRDNLKDVAVDLGIKYSNFSFCLDSREKGFKLQEDIDRGLNVGVEEIPTVFIHGERISGLVSYNEYEAAIKEKLGLNGVIMPEVEPIEIVEEEEPIEIVFEDGCTGCEYDDLCLNSGVREGNMYCGYDDIMRSQKEVGSECYEDHECLSNSCSESTCSNEEKPGFFGRILGFFKKIYMIE